jgi:hypothetical protein
MSGTSGARSHVVSTALREYIAVRHHVSLALAALAEAKSAPDEWHRGKALRRAFVEIDAAEHRLVAAIEDGPGPAMVMHCRQEMCKVDALASDARLWAAAQRSQPAEVIRLPLTPRRARQRAAARLVDAKNRSEVNPNLHAVANDAPTAC